MTQKQENKILNEKQWKRENEIERKTEIPEKNNRMKIKKNHFLHNMYYTTDYKATHKTFQIENGNLLEYESAYQNIFYSI